MGVGLGLLEETAFRWALGGLGVAWRLFASGFGSNYASRDLTSS